MAAGPSRESHDTKKVMTAPPCKHKARVSMSANMWSSDVYIEYWGNDLRSWLIH